MLPTDWLGIRRHLSFINASRPHRQLHSFPTRRSSDLAPRSFGARRDASWKSYRRDEPASESSSTGSRVRAPVEDDSDRKSTRLNSSHRCISYAVVCLKKKRRREDLSLQQHMNNRLVHD